MNIVFHNSEYTKSYLELMLNELALEYNEKGFSLINDNEIDENTEYLKWSEKVKLYQDSYFDFFKKPFLDKFNVFYELEFFHELSRESERIGQWLYEEPRLIQKIFPPEGLYPRVSDMILEELRILNLNCRESWIPTYIEGILSTIDKYFKNENFPYIGLRGDLKGPDLEVEEKLHFTHCLYVEYFISQLKSKYRSHFKEDFKFENHLLNGIKYNLTKPLKVKTKSILNLTDLALLVHILLVTYDEFYDPSDEYTNDRSLLIDLCRIIVNCKSAKSAHKKIISESKLNDSVIGLKFLEILYRDYVFKEVKTNTFSHDNSGAIYGIISTCFNLVGRPSVRKSIDQIYNSFSEIEGIGEALEILRLDGLEDFLLSEYSTI